MRISSRLLQNVLLHFFNYSLSNCINVNIDKTLNFKESLAAHKSKNEPSA